MLKTFALALALSASITLAGCSTVSNGTSGYAGPSAASYARTASSARRDIRRSKRDAKKAAALVAKLKKRVARDARASRKKVSAKRRRELVARLKRNRIALRSATRRLRAARRDGRIAEQQVARAERGVKRVTAARARAERVAERRKAIVERREARRKARAERIAKRRAQLAVDGTAGRRTAAWFGRTARGASAAQPVVTDPALAFADDYAAREDGGWLMPAIPVETMPKRLLRQRVAYETERKPGTVIVDTGSRYLYLVEAGGMAMRYGIGVGRQGFSWSGEAKIGWKQAWPKWTPPKEMIEREPKLAKYCADCGGMPGGIENPLGARALYLFQDGVDTLFRLHGTPDWRSIGTAASSGCIRMINQDVIDLYDRAKNGATVVVM